MRGLKCRFISCVLLCAVLCSFLCLSAGASDTFINYASRITSKKSLVDGYELNGSGNYYPNIKYLYNQTRIRNVETFLCGYYSISDSDYVRSSDCFYVVFPGMTFQAGHEYQIDIVLTTSDRFLVTTDFQLYSVGTTASDMVLIDGLVRNTYLRGYNNFTITYSITPTTDIFCRNFMLECPLDVTYEFNYGPLISRTMYSTSDGQDISVPYNDASFFGRMKVIDFSGSDDVIQAIEDDGTETRDTIVEQEQATQETIKEETEKQTSAIGGFFDKLLQGIKDFFTSLFIPDEIGTSTFTELLEKKLGFIYQVPSMLLSFLGTMFTAFSSGGAQSITFPGWSFGGYTFMEEYVIKRSDYQAIFDIIDPVFTIVGTILVVFAFCSGVKKLYNRILGGADNS